MTLLATLLTTLLALLHIYILTLEIFLWTTPRAHRAFNLTPTFAQQTRTMAANQGLYNGFLAAGLLWGVVHPRADVGAQIAAFFAGCVLVAGVFGGATSSPKIWLVQGLPGAVCLAAVVWA